MKPSLPLKTNDPRTGSPLPNVHDELKTVLLVLVTIEQLRLTNVKATPEVSVERLLRLLSFLIHAKREYCHCLEVV